MESLGTELPKEIARNQELLLIYAEIGQAGSFASAMIKVDIAKAVKAMAEGDLPAMIAAYQSLKDNKC